MTTRIRKTLTDYENQKFDTELGAVNILSNPVAIRYSVNSTDLKISYIGMAAVGTLGSAASWQIQEIDTTSGVIIKLADGDSKYNNVWDNRESLTYI